MNTTELLQKTVDFYASSHDANGLPVWRVLQEGVTLPRLTNAISKLHSEGALEVVFTETDENPHIRRLPTAMRKPFEELIARCDLSHACLYPSSRVIKERVDLSKWDNAPYTRQIWLGGSHLDLVFFDPAVLERYRSDPRYRYSQHFFGGSISLTDKHYEEIPSRDRAFIKRFGVGYDSKRHYTIGLMLSDLRGLSPEHQRIWREYQLEGPCKLNKVTFESWFFGTWPDVFSVYAALPEEFKVINRMAIAAYGKPMFDREYEEEVPTDYGLILRPTFREFLRFAQTLDLMLSENINKDFFPALLARSQTTQKEGSQITKEKGSLTLLKEWVTRFFTSAERENPAEEIVKPLQKVRKLRSIASHSGIEDKFDFKYEEDQRQLIEEVYGAVKTLRLILANHPAARTVHVPDWLFECKIASF